jgi:hypothetical protein
MTKLDDLWVAFSKVSIYSRRDEATVTLGLKCVG